MLQNIVNGAIGVGWTATKVAVAVPALYFLSESLETVFQDNETLSNLFESIGKLIEGAGDIFAKIGNFIGVDHLAGVGEDKLTGENFTKGFGIIPTVLGNLAGQTPQGVESVGDAVELVKKDPTPFILGGTAALAVTALDPNLAVSLHDRGAQGAKTVINVASQVGQKATVAAQFTGDQVSKFPQKISGMISNGGNHVNKLSSESHPKTVNAAI
jgi:hypothetical protein